VRLGGDVMAKKGHLKHFSHVTIDDFLNLSSVGLHPFIHDYLSLEFDL
jgi:hypothetical protein